MADMALRMLWFFVLACGLSWGAFLVIGKAIWSDAIEQSRIVMMRDEMRGENEHHISGMVMVPRTCDQLLMRADAIDERNFSIAFRTRQEASVACDEEDTPRAFRTVVFTRERDPRFIATLDGEPIPLVRVPYTGTQ